MEEKSLKWFSGGPSYSGRDRYIHHVSKKCTTFIFTITSKKVDQFHNVSTVKFRKDLREKFELKLPPSLESVTALPCEKQVVKYTALQHSEFSSKWWKTFNYGKCSQKCYFFIFLHRLISVTCLKSLNSIFNESSVFKMSAFGTYACFESWMPLVNGCVVPDVFLHNWKIKKWVMQQTKYCTNVIMTSIPGRKGKYTNENSWNRTYYSR